MTLVTTWRSGSIKSFIFIFFTLHQRTLKCYKERCLILHGKKQNNRKRTISISTDGGYRWVAQLNGKRTATGKENKHWERHRTFAKL